MNAKNNDERRPPQSRPASGRPVPVSISSPQAREIIPPPDYGGTTLLNTGKAGTASETSALPGSAPKPEARETASGVPYNPRNERRSQPKELHYSESSVKSGDSAAFYAAGRLPFEESVRAVAPEYEMEGDTAETSAPAVQKESTIPRRPVIGRSAYPRMPSKNTSGFMPSGHMRDAVPTAAPPKTAKQVYSERNMESDHQTPIIIRRDGRISRQKPALRTSAVAPAAIPALANLFSRGGTRQTQNDRNTQNERNAQNSETRREAQSEQYAPMAYIAPFVSEELLLCALIVLMLMSGSDEELAIILAFLLVSPQLNFNLT